MTSNLADGRLHEKKSGATVLATYTVDEFGRLRKFVQGAKTVEYALDAAGRRIARKLNGGAWANRMVYRGNQVVAEVDSAGQWFRHYVYATGKNTPDLMFENGANGTTVYRIISDHLGSLRLVARVDDAGTATIVQEMRYDEWGNVVHDTSEPGFERVPFGYAGGLYDRDTGLVRFGAREYDAETGRWVSKDPVGLNAGSNVYEYCKEDPVNLVDIDGNHPGETFSSAWDAARDALAFYNISSQREGVEYGGIIFMDADGGYHYTHAVTESVARVVPTDALNTDAFGYRDIPHSRIVGAYHTHPFAPGMRSEEISHDPNRDNPSDTNSARAIPTDLRCSQTFGTYVATPSGRMMWMYSYKRTPYSVDYNFPDRNASFSTEPGFLPH